MRGTRVRRRINLLETEARLLRSRGQVFCRFEEVTTDTARNRFIRAALERVTRLVQRPELVSRCRSLSASLARVGVGAGRPSRGDLAREQIGRNDAADRNMLALAELAFDLALPTEEVGSCALADPDREEAWVRKLFEKGVLGFAKVELQPIGWHVRGGVQLDWQSSRTEMGNWSILPHMIVDIMLDHPDERGRLVVDTKFTSMLSRRRFGEPGLKSGHLYQIYSYLRSQEGLDQRCEAASALLLYPSVGVEQNDELMVQNHLLRFATVDLSAAASNIRAQLRTILGVGASDRLH